MAIATNHQFFDLLDRQYQSLCNESCQTVLYKSVFEHVDQLPNIAALLLTSKSFQNSSFGANFLMNFRIEKNSILLLDSVLSPSSCFSLQFVPSLCFTNVNYSETFRDDIAGFVTELCNTKYLPLQLRSLTLTYVPPKVVDLFFSNSVSCFVQLRSLHLLGAHVDDAVMALIARSAVHLRELNMAASTGLTEVGLRAIAALSGITDLNLYSCAISDECLVHVAKLSNIATLDLDGCYAISDVGLGHISALGNLTGLNVAFCQRLTDVGLENISNLAGITALDLHECHRITDVGLQHIAQLSGLTKLSLSSCDITDLGLADISKLSSLSCLILCKCQKITDAGLGHLSQLRSLTNLDLQSCDGITQARIAEWKEMMPNCTLRN